MTSGLEELAGQIERLGEDDSYAELNADIYEALGYEVIRTRQTARSIAWKYRGSGPLYNNERWVSMNWFLRSIDAAMKLIPEDYHVLGIEEMPNGWVVKLGSRKDDRAPVAWSETKLLEHAITAASLRARAASEPSHGG
jgi:hypothetical protein